MAGLHAIELPRPLDSYSSGALAAVRAAGLVATIVELVVVARTGGRTASAFATRSRETAWKILSRHGVEVTSSGPLPKAPAVIVANHLTYLDPLVVSALAPCLSIAKGETRSWPLVGTGLEGLGVIFVRRGDAHSGAIGLRRALRALSAGISVLNFPEGTTSDGRSVGPFQRGAFGLAAIARVPVVPAHLAYDTDLAPWFGGQTFVPHYAKLARVRRVAARVSFGDPIEAHGADDPAIVADRVRQVIEVLHTR